MAGMTPLLPCPACDRHVRATDASCPFCGRELPLSLRSTRAPRLPSSRIGRSALFAFGVATSLSVTSCSGREDGEGDVDSGRMAIDAGPMIDEDTGPGPTDAGPDPADTGAEPADAGPPDSGGLMALYGAPSVDAGRPMRDDAGGGAVPLYGAPPEPAS